MKIRNIPKIGLSLLPFIKRPFIVLFNITQRCNLRCSYCYGQYYSDTTELSLVQASKILFELYALGARRLGLSGGEPLLYSNVDELIKYAVSIGYDVGINSNGILVPQHLHALRMVKNLSISLDGATEKTHDKYRGKGAFKKTIVGIEAAYDAGIPMHFCCTLTDTNADEWYKILDLAKKYNAIVQISPLYQQLSDGESEQNPKVLEKEKLRKIVLEIIEKKRNGYRVFFSEPTYRLILNWKDYDVDISPIREAGHPVCLAGRKIVTLDSYGNLYPCVRLSKQIKGQNCLELGVRKAYLNIPTPPCKSCLWACNIEYNSLLNLSLSSILNFNRNRNE